MKLLTILGLSLFLINCQSSKQSVFYEVVLETNNTKSGDFLLKPLYDKKDNQCGAFFLDENNTLIVINHFDTSQVFINLKYKYEKSNSKIVDTYTYEDIFLKKKKSYILESSLRDDVKVIEFKSNKVKVLDKTIITEVVTPYLTKYTKQIKGEKGELKSEIYTVKKVILKSVTYDKYKFPCD